VSESKKFIFVQNRILGVDVFADSCVCCEFQGSIRSGSQPPEIGRSRKSSASFQGHELVRLLRVSLFIFCNFVRKSGSDANLDLRGFISRSNLRRSESRLDSGDDWWG
jgi:hypothetical protein